MNIDEQRGSHCKAIHCQYRYDSVTAPAVQSHVTVPQKGWEPGKTLTSSDPYDGRGDQNSHVMTELAVMTTVNNI